MTTCSSGNSPIRTGEAIQSDDLITKIEERYNKDETDEFLKPIVLGGEESRIKGWSSHLPPSVIASAGFPAPASYTLRQCVLC